MFNRRFMDQVRQQLIKVLAQQARQARAAEPSSDHRYGSSDVVAFVDLQNLFFFLKENCRVPATQVHIPDMLREFAQMHGLRLDGMRIFTGIHDPRREPIRHETMAKRLRWLERNGAKVIALPLSYYTDRNTQEVRAQEKGVDVRIASELLRAVNDGLRRAIVITQDKDIFEAIRVATEMALERGREFTAFTPYLVGAEWEHNGRCGMHGLKGTTRLDFPVALARRHSRPERPRDHGREHPNASDTPVEQGA